MGDLYMGNNTCIAKNVLGVDLVESVTYFGKLLSQKRTILILQVTTAIFSHQSVVRFIVAINIYVRSLFSHIHHVTRNYVHRTVHTVHWPVSPQSIMSFDF